jgi:hypothetical protein
MKENIKDIQIYFDIITPTTYEEFRKTFPVVFDKLENPDNVCGNQGLRSLSVDFRRLRKGLGLTGRKKKQFTEWMTKFLDDHWDWWDLHGGTTKAYAEDENFEYKDRRWILISRRWQNSRPWMSPEEQQERNPQ